MKSINLFCCHKKVLIFMSKWMNGKSLMEYHRLKRKNFYRNLNIEDTTDEDYIHTKRVCKDFERENIGE